MKKINFVALCVFYTLSMLFAAGDTSLSDLNSSKIVVSDEVRKKYPIKPHHERLSFDCIDCHVGQGDNPLEFKLIGDEGCLSCHKSKQFLADRLKFMDTLKANPHNSVHDGPTLYCDECHYEHEKSINMCSECHAKEVPLWMKATP